MTITNLELLFEEQIARRLAHGFHLAAGMTEQQFRKEVEPLRSALPQIHCLNGHIPFTIVFPETRAPREKQIRILQHIVNPCSPPRESDLNVLTIAAHPLLLNEETKAYLITDVETGESLTDIETEAKNPPRRCWLNDIESLSILMDQPRLLGRHRVDCLASRYGNQSIINIYIDRSVPNAVPVLAKTELQYLAKNNFFPSCKKRVFQ